MTCPSRCYRRHDVGKHLKQLANKQDALGFIFGVLILGDAILICVLPSAADALLNQSNPHSYVEAQDPFDPEHIRILADPAAVQGDIGPDVFVVLVDLTDRRLHQVSAA